jgi:hypothetical protein
MATATVTEAGGVETVDQTLEARRQKIVDKYMAKDQRLRMLNNPETRNEQSEARLPAMQAGMSDVLDNDHSAVGGELAARAVVQSSEQLMTGTSDVQDRHQLRGDIAFNEDVYRAEDMADIYRGILMSSCMNCCEYI